MAKLAMWGASRDRRRRLLALALSLAVNGALLGVIAIRVGPTADRAEAPVVNVVLLPRPPSQPRPHAPRRPRRSRTAPPGLPVLPAEPGGGPSPSAPAPPPPGTPVEPRWRIDPQLVTQDTARSNDRRRNWRRVCFGMEGVLSTEEKALCERFWAQGHVPAP